MLWALLTLAGGGPANWPGLRQLNGGPRRCVATAGSVVLHALTNVPDAAATAFRLSATNVGSAECRCHLRRRLRDSLLVRHGRLGVGSRLLPVAGGLDRRHLDPGEMAAATRLASVKVWRELARYGIPLLIGGAVDEGKDVFNTVVVGSVLNAAALGNYRYGSRLGMLPGTVIIEIGSYVLFPASPGRRMMRPGSSRPSWRSLRALWLAAAPTAGITVIFGVPVTVLLLGQQWRDAGLMFASLAGFGLGVALAAVGFETIEGSRPYVPCCTGSTARGSWSASVSLLVLVQFGPVGIGLSLSISAFSAVFSGYSWPASWWGLRCRSLPNHYNSPLIAATAAAVSWGLVEHPVVHSEQLGFVLGWPPWSARASASWYLRSCWLSHPSRDLGSSDGGPPDGAARNVSKEAERLKTGSPNDHQ